MTPTPLKPLVSMTKSALKRVLPHSVKYRIRRQLERMRTSRPDYQSHAFLHKQQPLDENDPLSVKFHGMGSWFTQFPVNGKLYGGVNSFKGDGRIQDFADWVKPSGRVLELGSFEGIHSIMLSEITGVTEVLGLEGRDYLIAKSNFVKDVYGNTKISFKQCDLEVDGLTRYGKFDAVFCSGVLYHLSRPWKFIQEVSKVTDHFFLATHFSANGENTLEGYRGTIKGEFGYNEPLSGLNSYSFWMTIDSLKSALKKSGFEVVNERPWPEWPNGPWVHIYARKTS